MKIGYFLSCEEFGPVELVEQAVKAQRAGFQDLWISDHFHPWNDAQGHGSFVWSTIGAIARAAPGMGVGGRRVPPPGDGDSEQRAKETVHRVWPNEALPGELAQVLPTPEHFEQACQLVSVEAATESVPCGPDLDRHLEAIRAYEGAGFDELYVQQIGPHQDAFFDAYREHVLPRLRSGDRPLSQAGGR